MKVVTGFYSKYTVADIVKNDGWKLIAMSAFAIAGILFYHGFDINFINSTRGILWLFVGTIGPLITGILFAVKEIRLENNVLFYRTIFPTKWKSIILADISHISYFQKPVDRYSVFPKAVFYPSNNNRQTIICLLIPKMDIYKLLSIAYDCKVPVLFFNEFKNIEETSFYVNS